MKLLCQVVEDGYEFFAKRQLVTLFSAPNYCGEFDNAGGMMSVDESLMCSFQVNGHICRPTGWPRTNTSQSFAHEKLGTISYRLSCSLQQNAMQRLFCKKSGKFI